MSGLRLTLDARRACFSAAVVAVACGEDEISARRIGSALLRDESVHAFCRALSGSVDALIETIDGHRDANFQQITESIEHSLAAKNESFGSPAHINSLKLLPLSAAMKMAFDSLAERVAATNHPSRSIDLLVASLEMDAGLRTDFANFGLPLEAIRRQGRD